MAKPKVGTGKGRRIEEEEGLDPVEEAEIEVVEFLTQFEDAYSVILYRRPTPLSEEEYLGTFPVSGFERDIVRDQYGGGSYRITLRNSNGRHIQNSGRKFRIGGAAIYPDRAPKPGGLATMTAAPADPTLQAIMERLDKMERAHANPPAPPPPDPIEQFTKMAEAMKAAGFGSPPTSPVDEIMDAMRKGMNFQRDIMTGGSRREKREPYAGVVEAFGKPFGNLVEALVQESRARRSLPPAAPRATETADLSPNGAPPEIHHHPAPVTDMPSLSGLAKLQAYIPKIQRWARNGVDPYARALIVLEKQDEETCRQMLEALEDPQLIEQVVGFIPLNGEHEQAWAREFLEEVRDELKSRAADGAPMGDGGDDDGEGEEAEGEDQ